MGTEADVAPLAIQDTLIDVAPLATQDTLIDVGPLATQDTLIGKHILRHILLVMFYVRQWINCVWALVHN